MNSYQELVALDVRRRLAHLADIADVMSWQQKQSESIMRSNLIHMPSHFPVVPGVPVVPVAPVSGAFPGSNLKRVIETATTNIDAKEPAPKKQRKQLETVRENVRFRDYQAEIWSEKFQDLCEFRRKHGHCHVPHTYKENVALAQWVKRQRYQFKLKQEGKRSTLTDERVKILDQIGFIWNSHDAVWEERWNELLEYKRIHKDCIVPSSFPQNPQLAVWVKRQRRQYKLHCEGEATSMTPERITKLEKLGFAWDCRKPKGSPENPISPPPPPVVPTTHSSIDSYLQQQQQQQNNPSACEFLSFSRRF